LNHLITNADTTEQDEVARRFARSLSKAETSYNQDHLDDCISECQDILEESSCPRYRRIKALIMLGSCVADLSEVGSCYREADRLWHLARDQHSENDVSANEALEELQLLLHELHVVIVRESQEEDLDPDAVDEDEAMPDTIRNVAEAETKMYGEDALSEVEKLILDPDYVEQEGSPVFEGAPQAPTPHDEQMLEVDVSEGSAEEKTAPAAPHKERGPEKAEVDAPGEQGVVAEKQLKVWHSRLGILVQ